MRVFHAFDPDSPDDVRKDVLITAALSVVLIGLASWSLWHGRLGIGLAELVGATVFLWLARRNHRIARDRGWRAVPDSDGVEEGHAG